MESRKAYGPHEAVALGIELENAGHNFYTRVADCAVDHRVKEVFEQLAKAEMKHLKIIREEIEPMFAPEWYREEDQLLMAEYLRDVERQPAFPDPEEAAGYCKVTETTGKAIDIGIMAEKRSMGYFAYLRDVTADEKGKEAFNRLYLEEEKHLKLLEELKDQL
jgi:rubrerythrin